MLRMHLPGDLSSRGSSDHLDDHPQDTSKYPQPNPQTPSQHDLSIYLGVSIPLITLVVILCSYFTRNLYIRDRRAAALAQNLEQQSAEEKEAKRIQMEQHMNDAYPAGKYRNSRLKQLRKADSVDGASNTEECAICLKWIQLDDSIRQLDCDHCFHRLCIDEWVRAGRDGCPLCRHSMVRQPEKAHLAPELA